jgi:Sec-independent protein translocase protein TatA
MGIGFSEIVLILVVAYFLFGPEKLPKVIAEFMKTVNSLLKMKDDFIGSTTDIKKDLEESITEIKKDFNNTILDVKNEIVKPVSEIEKSVTNVKMDFNNTITEVRTEIVKPVSEVEQLLKDTMGSEIKIIKQNENNLNRN